MFVCGVQLSQSGASHSPWDPAPPAPPRALPECCPSAPSASLCSAFPACLSLCLLNSGFHQGSVSSWKAGATSALSCTVRARVYFSSIILRHHLESKVLIVMFKNHIVSIVFMPTKTRELHLLKKSSSEALPSNLLCRIPEGHLPLTFGGLTVLGLNGPNVLCFWWVCC